MKTLYVGNLPWETTDDELYDVFEKSGGVEEVRIVKDRDTGRSKGFGFVEMMSEDEADSALKMFDGYSLNGRVLRVNKAIQNTAKADKAKRSENGPTFQRRGEFSGSRRNSERSY